MKTLVCIYLVIMRASINAASKTFRVFANKCGLVFSLLFLTAICSIQAQQSQLRFKHYTTAEGLSQGDVYHTTQDSRGFMWFGTFDGLNRFDGYEFKVFKPSYNDSNSIEGARINYIVEDKTGMLWVGTNEALNCYNYKTGYFKHYYIKAGLHKKLKGTYQPIFIDDKNELWFSFESDLASINLLNGIITTYPFAAGVMQGFIAADYPAKKFYRHLSKIYTFDRDGLHVIDIDHKKVSFYFSSNLKNEYGKKTLIAGVTEDEHHVLWLGTINGLMYFNPVTKETSLYTYQSKKNIGTIFLGQDNESNIWCGGSAGLFIFSTSTKKFIQNYPKDLLDPESIGQNTITSVFADKDNNIWVGIDPQGIDQINPTHEQLNHIKLNPLQRSLTSATSIWSVSEIDSNNILICCNHKDLVIYNRLTSKSRQFNVPQEFKEFNIEFTMVDSRKRIWIASEKGLLYSDDNLNTIKLMQNFNVSIFPVYLFEFNKRILIGSFNGLFSIPINKQISTADTMHLFDGKQISFINKSPTGLLGVSTGDDEWFLLRMDGLKVTLLKKKDFNFFIKSIYFQDENIVWFGTTSGLACYNISKDSLKVFTEKDGLANNCIYSLVKGKDGRLWMSTNHGISKFDIATKRFTNYGIAEGAQALEFNTHSFYQSSLGIIYFGGVKGFNYFNPSKIKEFAFKPPLQLLNVTINGKAISLENFLDQKKSAEFKSNENNISIEFAAIDFNRNDNIDYLYKLHDKDSWTSNGNSRTLNFVNLSPGKYTVEVEAQYSYNETSPHILKIAFTVLPPFYKTWWFITIICIAFTLMVYSLYMYRVSQLRRLYEMRTKISRDLHDDMGSTLGSISIYSEVAKNRSAKNENADEALAKIGSASRELIDKIGDIVWSINPNNESLEQLQNRMSAYAAVMLTPHEIQYNFYADKAVKNTRLTAEEKKNIYLIYKESIHNIIKYAICSQVEINMSLHVHEFVMSIKDNGRGFDTNNLYSKKSLGGNGIKNMQARAESIHAVFNIHSVINAGTTISLALKI